MKQMTYLDIILWIQENVYEITQDLDEVYTIMYHTGEGTYHSVGSTLIECVLTANNVELILEKPLDLTPRTPDEQAKAVAWVDALINGSLYKEDKCQQPMQ